MEKTDNKTKWVHVRLSEDEYNTVNSRYKKTTYRKLSQYVRAKLLDKQMTTLYRNKSLDDFMTELIQVRKSLFAVSNNFNQAVRKLNSMRLNETAHSWILVYEAEVNNAIQHVEQTKENIQKFAEKWLQDSTLTRP